jgi:hypothetical protein
MAKIESDGPIYVSWAGEVTREKPEVAAEQSALTIADQTLYIEHDEIEIGKNKTPELSQRIINLRQLLDLMNQGYLTRETYDGIASTYLELKNNGGVVLVISENRIKTIAEYYKDGVTNVSNHANFILDEHRRGQTELEYRATAISTDVKTDFSGSGTEVVDSLPDFTALIAMITEMKQQGPDGDDRYFGKLLSKSQGPIWLLGKITGENGQPDIMGVRVDREGHILIRQQDISRLSYNTGTVKSSQSVTLGRTEIGAR